MAKEYHLQPSEVDKLPFYEYEMYLEEMNLIAKKQEEENRKQQEEYDSMKSTMNPSKMMNQTSQNFKAPNVSAPSMPSISMPKMPTVNIPKL